MEMLFPISILSLFPSLPDASGNGTRIGGFSGKRIRLEKFK
jgi:hypothetical protein